MLLAKRTSYMKGSPILMLAARAGELKAAGHDVVSLTVGEPDWDTYDHIKKAAIDAIDKGKGKYTPPAGIPELRKAVAAQVSKDLGLNYEPSQVTITTGAKFVLFSALQTLCNPGDEVIIPAPFWASYTTMVELAEGMPKIVVCDESVNFKMTAELFRKAITSKTKVLLLNSPSNPTGLVYTREELSALAEVLRENPQIAVLSDDIYNRLVFDGQSVAPHLLHVAPDLKDRTVLLNGASKSYAMTGWRVGWGVGPKNIIETMSNYQSQSVSCASAISQWATVEAVLNSEQQIKQTIEILKSRRDFILNELQSIEGISALTPQGAFYIWMDVKKYLGKKHKGLALNDTSAMAKALLETEMVAVVPGIEFGLEGYFRLSFALENSKAKTAIERMKKFFYGLQS